MKWFFENNDSVKEVVLFKKNRMIFINKKHFQIKKG